MTAVFDRHGIRFFYPENWNVTEVAATEGGSAVTIQAKSGAFWSVATYSRSITPDSLLDQAVAAMKEEYDGLEVDSADEQIGSRRAAGRELNFFYLDLLVTTRLLAWQTPAKTVLVMFQAENQEFSAMEMVFAALNTSFVRETEGG